MILDLSQKLDGYKTRVEGFLLEWINAQPLVSKKLRESTLYSLMAGGKRIRPALCYASSEALGEDVLSVDALAMAVECIHSYSLIHDDLPAMDDDDLRRGKATNHIAFDEATAILAGDALQTYAFQILSDSTLLKEIKNPLGAIHFLAKCSGAQGMVGGQMLDLQFENQACSHSELKNIHEHKTGRLLGFCTQGVALALNAEAQEQLSLKNYGRYIGLSFQIVDDILDVTQNTEALGKNAGSDVSKAKSTYVSIHGLDKAKEMAEDLTSKALHEIKIFGKSAKTLEQLAVYILERRV